MFKKTWFLLALGLGLAGAVGIIYACSSGNVVNSFEQAGCNEDTAWTKAAGAFNYTVLQGGVGNNFAAADQAYYAYVTWTATNNELKLTSAGFKNSSGANWSGSNVIRLAYATVDNDLDPGSDVQNELYLNDGSNLFHMRGPNAVTKSAIVTASDWSYLIVSLNFLANMGLNLSSISYVSIKPFGVLSGNYELAYDDLFLGTIAPNSQVSAAAITANPSCGQVQLSWPAQSQSGADPVYGYHIYRSSNNAVPWTSLGFVTSTAFTDNSPGATNYYCVLPYSTSTTNAPAGVYAAGINPSSNGNGIHEALISSANSKGPVSPPLPGPVPAPTSLTGIGCSTPEIDLSWVPGTFSGCNTVQYYVVQRAAASDPTFSSVQESRTAGTNAFQDLAGNGISTGASYLYRVWTVDNLNSVGNSATVGPITASGASCSLPTPQPTSTFTPTPVPTAAPNANAGAYVYPNPFSPDKGEVFHVGNVPAGSDMTIYNMVGELVFKKTLTGNYSLDVWDGNNNNGVKVVTGVYFLTISGSSTVYKVAVLRQGQ